MKIPKVYKLLKHYFVMEKQGKLARLWKEIKRIYKLDIMQNYVNPTVCFVAILYIANTLPRIHFDFSDAKKRANIVQSPEVREARGFGDIDFSKYKGKLPYESKEDADYSDLEKKALGWVKYSHLLTAAIVDYEYGEGFDPEKTFETGRGNCQAHAVICYSKFLELSDRLEMPEMRDNVRLAVGPNYDARIHGWIDHAYLEIKFDGKWKPYETAGISLENGIRVSPKGAQIFEKINPLGNPQDYIRKMSVQIDSSRNTIIDLEVIRYLTDVPGLVGEYINQRKQKKYYENQAQIQVAKK